MVKESDAIIWAFPLYVMLVHASYKRFIELVFERGSEDAFRGKYACALSTSIKFFDYTAHNYIHAVCDDLGMNFAGIYSAEMRDLLDEKERKKLLVFSEEFIRAAREKEPYQREYLPVDAQKCVRFKADTLRRKTELGERKAVIVTDSMEEGENLTAMAEYMRDSFSPAADIVDISRINMKGGCLGCIHCGFDNICAYDGKDDVRPTYEKLRGYDIIVFAGAVHDRYLSALWKQFTDRRFWNTHQPMFVGKQFAYLISGPLSQIPNMRHILQTMIPLEGSNLCGFVTDEQEGTEGRIEAMAAKLVRMAEAEYIQPMTGPEVAGRMVFRDHMYGELRFVFQGDHRYYKKHGWYDFPQKNIGQRINSLFMIWMSKIPSVKKYMQKNMKTLMLRNYKPLFETQEQQAAGVAGGE